MWLGLNFLIVKVGNLEALIMFIVIYLIILAFDFLKKDASIE